MTEKTGQPDNSFESLMARLRSAIATRKEQDKIIAGIWAELSGRVDEAEREMAMMEREKAMLGELMGDFDQPNFPRSGRRNTTRIATGSPQIVPTESVQKAGQFFWQWIFPAVMMFVVLWFIFAVLLPSGERSAGQGTRSGAAVPRLMSTVHAVEFADDEWQMAEFFAATPPSLLPSAVCNLPSPTGDCADEVCEPATESMAAHTRNRLFFRRFR